MYSETTTTTYTHITCIYFISAVTYFNTLDWASSFYLMIEWALWLNANDNCYSFPTLNLNANKNILWIFSISTSGAHFIAFQPQILCKIVHTHWTFFCCFKLRRNILIAKLMFAHLHISTTVNFVVCFVSKWIRSYRLAFSTGASKRMYQTFYANAIITNARNCW